MSVGLSILLVWLAGLPLSFVVLLLVYPPYMRRRARTHWDAAPSNVIPLRPRGVQAGATDTPPRGVRARGA